MVEEMIAAGLTPEEVIAIYVRDYGLSESDAALVVQTALGGVGDVVEIDEDGG